MCNDQGPPIRRWSQVLTDAGGVAAGQQSAELVLEVPADGYIVAVFASVFDPALNAAETINSFADTTSGVAVKLNTGSLTNFKFIRLRAFAQTGNGPGRRTQIKVKIRDVIKVQFSNDRSAGNALQYRLDVGFCDPEDVEREAAAG